MALRAVELPLADHVHRFDSGNEHSRAALALEPQHWPHDTLDRSVVLLDDVVQILRLAKDDLRIVLGGVVVYGSATCATHVDGDPIGLAMAGNGTRQEPACRGAIALGSEKKIDRMAVPATARYKYCHCPAILT